MKNKFKRITTACLASIMCLPLVGSATIPNFTNATKTAYASNGSAVTTSYDTVKFEKVTGNVDVTSVVLNNLSNQVLEASGLTKTYDGKTTTVIVSLDSPAIVDYVPENYTVAQYIASPAGQNKLTAIRSMQEKLLKDISALDIDYKVVDYYDTVVNAVAIEVNTSALASIKTVKSVASTVVSETYAYPETVATSSSNGGAQRNPSNVYETGIYDTSDCEYDGSGMTVAVLDTGLDYTHEAYQKMPNNATLGLTISEVQSGLAGFTATARSAQKGETLEASDLYVSDKVPFAYDYADDDADVYPSYSQHGAHVAGIIGGQAESYTNKDGELVVDENGDPKVFRGSAPEAQLVICKVFTDDLDDKDIGGATSEDIIAALEDCVKLGVDVINMSLGTSAGFSTIYIDGDSEGALLNEIYTSIKEQGISLMCAASNDYSSGYGSNYGTNLRSNPDSGTVGSPSTFVGAMSVASINGIEAPYMVANASATKEGDAIFYEEATDANYVEKNFAQEMLGNETSKTFKYVVIPGVGREIDYTTTIKAKLADKKAGEKVIAVVKRGTNTFQEKVEIAMKYADAIIIYNNVAGLVRMNLGDIVDPIPAVSVSIDAGTALAQGAKSNVGYIEINKSYSAGPFMNDYSSWGSTPDLKLKPDVTSHGGDITSTVAGGYDEMSGTSMATPNLAGLTALVRSYVQDLYPDYTPVQVTTLTNQLLMSTAETVYTEIGLPYSPRKQGAGLATMNNIFSTSAYLYTIEGVNNGAEDNRPKIELGAFEKESGSQTYSFDLNFFVKNFKDKDVSFSLKSMLFTETLAIGGLAVAEKAYMLDGSPVWEVNGAVKNEGDEITVNAGQTATIKVNLTLSKNDIKYITESFPNGMFVEGFIKLDSLTEGQCDLNLPYMGFYGDWEAAPMLDYDCYEIAEFEKDTSTNDDEKPKASVWATQVFASYYNNKYVVPMGGYAYLQDENADQIYTDRDYAAISCFNEYYGEGSADNYMTTTGLKALYVGLLRNAELVTYDIYNVDTGEVVIQKEAYRVGKAYAAGGRATPGNVRLEYTPEELGLVANGKYQMDFKFYFNHEDADNPEKQNEENTFSMTFYIDYEAPIMLDSRIKYRDYEENNKTKQKVYLEVDVYDNHYPQSLMLCYAENDEVTEELELMLATEYVTPIYNPKKNGTTTVSIDITDFYEKYKNRLYIQIDDYALNHNVYSINFMMSNSNENVMPDTFEIAGNGNVNIGINQTATINLNYEGHAHLANFIWTSSNPEVASVRNGEVIGLSAGETIITVQNNKGVRKNVTVVVSDTQQGNLTLDKMSFGVIETYGGSIEKAQGGVEVKAGDSFKLDLVLEPWYYPQELLTLKWTSTNPSVATVDQNGNVETKDKRGTAVIKATILKDGVETAYSTSVTLYVQEPFTLSSMTLTRYDGKGDENGVVVIPNDKNVMYIGQNAFKDNLDITAVVIPRTVVNIEENAFLGCSNLKYVYFVSEEAEDIPSSDLTLIYRNAFSGCTSLEMIDLTNVRKVTFDKMALYGCSGLKEIKKMSAVCKMDDMALYGCSSLKSADITGLHTSGQAVFGNCTSLESVITDKYTVLGKRMFSGCISLREVTLNSALVPDNAFEGCGNLNTVNFGNANASEKNIEFTIGANAFNSCFSLENVNFNGYNVLKIGDGAFANCEILTEITIPSNYVLMGYDVFKNTPVTVSYANGNELVDGAVYNGTVLIKAPDVIDSSFTIRAGTTEIAPYAFAYTTFNNVESFTIPSTIAKIGKGAFINVKAKEIVLGNITEISEYAFYNSSIERVYIGKNITSIGAYAFASCGKLALIEFVGLNDSLLSYVGSNAFAGTAITSIEMPEGKNGFIMGDLVFAHCEKLETVILPSLTGMGYNTFLNTPVLTQVVFGENSTTSGAYTFSAVSVYDYYDRNVYDVNITSVDFGANTVIGIFAFYKARIASFDFSGITEIGDGAFMNCTNLATLTNTDGIEIIGVSAFKGCDKLGAFDFESVKYIGHSAFAIENENAQQKFETLTLGSNVEYVGGYAFFGTKVKTVSIAGDNLAFVGEAAFANATNLTAINVTATDSVFFSENGVLYRNVYDVINNKVNYELVSYPTAKKASLVDNKRVYEVKEGTTSVLSYAFVMLESGVIDNIVLPYSIKTIGDSAFYMSGIKKYRFESINAPVLLSDARDNGVESFHSLYSRNFENHIIQHADKVIAEAVKSTLVIEYPSNGVGYDNWTYSTYFGFKVTLGTFMTDTIRALKETIESWNVETVRGWLNLDVNDDNKAIVKAFADEVKSAHFTYNNNKSDSEQMAFLGEDNVAKIFEIESELKAVKTKFAISVKATSLTIDSTSTHRENYVEGESFDATGLVLTVVYDDYSTETANIANLTIPTTPLTVYNRYVTVSGYGVNVRVKVNVTEQAQQPDEPETDETPDIESGDNSNDSGCASKVGEILLLISSLCALAFVGKKGIIG